MLRSARRLQSTVAAAPKSHPVRNFIVKTVLAATVFYSAGCYYSTQNDQFCELFTDNVPLAEPILETFESLTKKSEKLSLEDLKTRFGSVAVPNLPVSATKVSEIPQTPASQNVSKSQPKVTLPSVSVKAEDGAVAEAVATVNALVAAVNSGADGAAQLAALESLFAKLDAAAKTGNKAADVAANVAAEIAAAKTTFESEFAAKLVSAEHEITEKFLAEFNAVKTQLENVHARDLAAALEANKNATDLQLANQIHVLKNEALKSFADSVAAHVAAERGSKLANLEQLSQDVASLSETLSSLEDVVARTAEREKKHALVASVKAKLAQDVPQPLPELEQLKGDALVDAAVAELESKGVVATGVLSQAQLKQRWDLLLPELRSVSLLPPNAGLLGHFTSILASKLMFSKAGSPEGNDIESVIARVNQYLLTNRLDDAVEEVALLKGWSRKLADDWLVESRKRLETVFLLELIETV